MIPPAPQPLECALAYAHRGWQVFPCQAGGKEPMTARGFQDASTEEDQIRRWWRAAPTANVAVATSAGLAVLDVDPRHGGDDTLAAWAERSWALPACPSAKTGGGGCHFYLAAPSGLRSVPALAPGVDLKAEGGYVIAPPSLHPSGGRYQWFPDAGPDVPLPPAPEWLLQLIEDRAKGILRQAQDGARAPLESDAPIIEGERNATLARVAGALRRVGLDPGNLEAVLQGVNRARCRPPLPEGEVKGIAASIARYEPQPTASPTVTPVGVPPFEAKRGLVLTPLATLLGEPEEAVSWLWENTLPTGGLSLVAAKPKVGKSTLARNLALAIARGEMFLGRATTQGPVVYLALEEKRSEVKGHFLRMGAGEESIFIHVGGAPEEALDALGRAIRDAKAALAIVDPLLRLVRLRDANDYAEVTRALEPLLFLARETGCHILTVHHLGKLDREGGDGILGSTALFGAVDTALMMKRRDDARTIESQQRYGEDIPKTVLSFDRETGILEATGTVEELEKQRMEITILEALGDGEKAEREIRDALGGNTGLVSKVLRSLVAEGKVARQGGGGKKDPYRYSRILVSCFPTIDKQQKQENNNDRLEV